jgi:hypothetical protein
VTNSSSVLPWTLLMPAGSAQNWTFSFTTTAPGGVTPYSISATAWEYVVRSSATDMGTPLVKLTPTAGTNGVLTVTSTATVSSVEIEMFPVATAALTPGAYFHALWEYPSTTTAVTWATGNLIVQGNPQP